MLNLEQIQFFFEIAYLVFEIVEKQFAALFFEYPY